MATSAVRQKFIDIGANLTDPMFQGIYNGSKKHVEDLHEVIKRAIANGVGKIIVTGGSLEDSKASLELAKTNDVLYTTVGCHPTRCKEFDESGEPESYLQQLKMLVLQNKEKVVAVGECGLDYDRQQFCPKEIQQRYFEHQFDIAESTCLPMFLHCRNSASDLVTILKRNRERFSTAVVHSFDGSKEEAREFLDLGLYIGINGCSLKTSENVDVVASLPSERIMIETDSPWCEIRPSHASSKHVKTVFQSKKKEKFQSGFLVKNRNEPSNIIQVLEVIAAVRNQDVEELATVIFENTMHVFFQSCWS
ncbi:putative deoxyribonuclease TATDN1 [Limulus polyphemus]|uniref:Deoxyribonuclease TATDN1 n=1 Tax=Limulus polyphemus TaxID=6850 RepID=A0ABM1BW79_LIMPO|nr:putative deoxyribonuclease TATDN1 [Limulus polyphemus]